MSNSEEQQGVPVPARIIAHPKSISAAARQVLAKLAAMPHERNFPPLSDREAWRALQREYDDNLMLSFLPPLENPPVIEKTVMNGIPVFITTPTNPPVERIYLNIHGGAFVFGSGEFCRRAALTAAQDTEVTTISVDYRMPPDFPYPTPLDDCVAVYREALKQYPAEQIVIGGGSAGGNLAAALVLKARDEGLPLPAGLVLLSPEVDLTESGDSFETNRYIDVALYEGLGMQNALYANGHDLHDPYLSPLFADFHPGFPKTFLQTGTRDLFLSNTVRMHRALLKAGIDAELHVFEGMPHGGFLHATPEDTEMRDAMRQFIARCWKH